MTPLHLQPDHDEAIRRHARQTYPHECCGFLLGRDDAGGRRISMVTAALNDRGEEELHNRFTITPAAYQQADKTARASGLDILGFYHSHPNAPARPSQYDLDHAWPVYSYIIVEVRDGEPKTMTCWILQDDRSVFDEQRIAIAAQHETQTEETK